MRVLIIHSDYLKYTVKNKTNIAEEIEDAKKNGIPDLSFFKMPIVGGEPITPREMESINELLKFCGSPATMFDGYGMSELFSVFSTQKEETKSLEDKRKPVICAGTKIFSLLFINLFIFFFS